MTSLLDYIVSSVGKRQLLIIISIRYVATSKNVLKTVMSTIKYSLLKHSKAMLINVNFQKCIGKNELSFKAERN